MTAGGRILIIDDDDAFLQSYRELLGAEGYDIDVARERSVALALLDRADWDVVLVDQKLHGESGPDDGIGLLPEVLLRSPGAKAIVVTAYATPEMIQRAFATGAYDYLEKTGRQFSALVRAKVRNALELVRERRLASLDSAGREDSIRQLWKLARSETDRHRKGKLLEELLLLIFRSIPGLHHVQTNVKNEIEEIDLLLRNESADPFWSKEGQYIAVECKNWSSVVGVPEWDRFAGKVRRRFGRCRLGFFVAMNGFARTVQLEQLAAREKDQLIVAVGPEDLARLVAADDRSVVLKELHDRALMATGNGNGH